jgi:hypothetical protein
LKVSVQSQNFKSLSGVFFIKKNSKLNILTNIAT